MSYRKPFPEPITISLCPQNLFSEKDFDGKKYCHQVIHPVMSTKKIFFSYSRHDSVFALRLAKDIMQAGEDVWIDQLDIPAGALWDVEIERALTDASFVLVILSPFSAASENVQDEISFALYAEKKIIPVMLETCIAPFRLRRLKRIDFSKSYEEGLNLVLEAVKEQALMEV